METGIVGASIRQQLLNRSGSVGTWVQIGHPTIVEILVELGYDWLGIDCEHTDIDLPTFATLARTAAGRLPVLARVRENDTLAIRQVLDCGADGVIVPLVGTAHEAEHAVRAAKYPPRGVRGHAFMRANGYGMRFAQYAQLSDAATAVVVMIETVSGVESIADILRVDGVDAVFIGPYDMSGSYGVPGQTDHPLVADACRRVLEECERAGKACGIHVVVPTPERILDTVKAGYKFIAVGLDTGFLASAASDARRVARIAFGS